MGYIHGGKVVARALRAENVPFVFTLCGGHVMSIYDGCIDEGIRVIDVRHEQTAGHNRVGVDGNRRQYRSSFGGDFRYRSAALSIHSSPVWCCSISS